MLHSYDPTLTLSSGSNQKLKIKQIKFKELLIPHCSCTKILHVEHTCVVSRSSAHLLSALCSLFV